MDPNHADLSANLPKTRGYQQEMLQESLRRNIVIALDTGSGKTHIAVLRLKHEAERQTKKARFIIIRDWTLIFLIIYIDILVSSSNGRALRTAKRCNYECSPSPRWSCLWSPKS